MLFRRKAGGLILFLAILIIPLLVLTACDNPPLALPGPQDTSPPTTVTTTAASPQTTATRTSTPVLSGTISEVGSTTIQPLAEKLAADFMAINPGIRVDIKGGGSSVGIKAAFDGTADIGASSRDLTPDDPPLVKHLLARDGIAVMVNPANPVSNLTRSQIADILSGRITNWSQVGGPDSEIHVAAREEGSGTRAAFQELIMGKDSIVRNAILQNSSGAIVQVVRSDPRAISFDSFGYVNSLIKALAVDGVAANLENARSGRYPVTRPLYFLTRSQPAGAVRAFIDYCTGPEGQKIITAEGYISVQ